MTLSWTLDKLGPLCLSADDCGLVLEVISGYDPKDPSTDNEPWSYEPEERDWKIAVPKDILEEKSEPVSDNFKESVKALEKFASTMTTPQTTNEALP